MLQVYSEDPCLTSALAHGYVAGIQNAGSWEPRPSAVLQAGACCKHLAAYDVEGCSEGSVCNGQNRMTNDANVTTRSMWEHYLPAFHSCTVEAKAIHAMCSYNSINGVPTWYDSILECASWMQYIILQCKRACFATCVASSIALASIEIVFLKHLLLRFCYTFARAVPTRI